MNSTVKSHAIVGCGGRALWMFANPILQRFAHRARLVGLCDINPGRMDYYNHKLNARIPTFTDFDRMIQETKPDRVIVTTKDALHHSFILRAFEHGCDVICEKPMAINEVQCREILAAEQRTGRTVTVTFNYRFVPYVTRVRELLGQGIIGKILSIDFSYQLDRIHGADYFRRWHRRKENSGGLLVHKSTHHFDLINWLTGQDPATVHAIGSRQFYGPTRKERGERCLTCDHKKTCEFYFDIQKASAGDKALYADVEHFDGYHRDQCVFSDEIDIEDTMNLTVKYSGGVQMSYSLNAHCIYEGWRMAFNGTDGRLEAEEWHSGPYVNRESQEIRIHRPNQTVERNVVTVDRSGHGGGDTRLLEMLFDGPRPDPLSHMASSRAGAMSILTGIAANHSIASGQPVTIASLIGS